MFVTFKGKKVGRCAAAHNTKTKAITKHYTTVILAQTEPHNSSGLNLSATKVT